MNASKYIVVCMMLLLVVSGFGYAQMRTIEGKGEEYHHAMYLNFKHASEQAQALFTQTVLPYDFSMEIAREHVDEIWTNLERARIQHAMVHKTYGSDETRMIMENHDALLKAHLAATETCKMLRNQLAGDKPSRETIKKLAGELFGQTSKAAAEHLEGMKKLGLTQMMIPS